MGIDAGFRRQLVRRTRLPSPPVGGGCSDGGCAFPPSRSCCLSTNPAGAAQVLAAKGMTQAQLDELMFKIAVDPKLSEQFEKHAKR
jgi:hypothetical protein